MKFVRETCWTRSWAWAWSQQRSLDLAMHSSFKVPHSDGRDYTGRDRKMAHHIHNKAMVDSTAQVFSLQVSFLPAFYHHLSVVQLCNTGRDRKMEHHIHNKAIVDSMAQCVDQTYHIDFNTSDLNLVPVISLYVRSTHTYKPKH